MIRTKRESLEQFLKEQLIGPGGCKGMFSLKSNLQLEKQQVLGEVISTTPGSIYTTAILFPMQTAAVKAADGTDVPPSEEEATPPVASSENEDDQGENEIEGQMDVSSEDDDDLASIDRRFPSSIGISCCLDADFNGAQDLKVVISGRYYTKVIDTSQLEVVVENYKAFKVFLEKNSDLFEEWFLLVEDKLSLKKPFSSKDLTSYKQLLRARNSQITNEIAEQTKDDTIKGIDEKNRFLSSYKERLFKKYHSLDHDRNYMVKEEVQAIKARVATIEQYETFFSYFDDLLSACNKWDFGFWVEHPFTREVDLSSLELNIPQERRKATYTFEKYECLKDVFSVDINTKLKLSISAGVQLIKSKDNRTYLKIQLTNTSTPFSKDSKHFFSIVTEKVNERSFFGIKLDISSPHLCAYKERLVEDLEDKEVRSLNFLYRGVLSYGVGHFCSVSWEKKTDGMHVFSEFLPSVETPDVEFIPRNKDEEELDSEGVRPKAYLEDNQCLQFKWLSFFSGTKDDEIKTKLLEFINAYKGWIDSQTAKVEHMQDPNTAKQNLTACEADYQRMKRNVVEFLSDSDKMKSFRIMNGAMFMQLWHSKKDNQQYVYGKQNGDAQLSLDFSFYQSANDEIFAKGQHAAWRPFQLAFILLNLDGIFQSVEDSTWKHRNELVDLVWFPTGGGKTEAYLGLIALTIINRRRTKGDRGYGVTAIMRYTLRLLTTQQFQRALRLILALEQIRLWKCDKYDLGNEQISVGLFVGEDSLPNHISNNGQHNRPNGLIEECNIWNEQHYRSKIPLDVCPLCGAKLTFQTDSKKNVQFYCSNVKCTFDIGNAELPVRLCDEDIYRKPPTLLFGTVDKFAQLAHKVSTDNRDGFIRDSRRLFGRGLNQTAVTPDLIIQDELHLLLGPLGSAVSLYECVIDQLCTRNENGINIRPKIISSTATTRNTSLQVRALYDRNVSIFPHNGLDYDDSFYAFYKRTKQKGENTWRFVSKRKYVGIMPSGRTQMTTQMRLAAILFVHRALFEKEHIDKLYDKDFIKAADYYFTTISYFNSLKEVGKTDAQFYMEFTKYTRRLFKRVLRYSDMLECFYSYDDAFDKSELTGRLSGNDAVAALNDVQTKVWSPTTRIPHLQDEAWQYPIKPDDFILATNMISVGLDVSRFNTIIINSMPRNIAEYIQATSRVARDKEGLVLTLHNPFRSRDVSHYEHFREFHEKLYYYVEPISITPFSHKSVDKYLPLFLGAYVRQLYPNLANSRDAYNITKELAAKIASSVKQYFKDRLQQTQKLEGGEKELLTQELFEYISKKVDDLLGQWIQKKLNNPSLVYENSQKKQNLPQLYTSTADYSDVRETNIWNAPNAVRVLDPEAVINMLPINYNDNGNY